jgi:biotin-dependent carboxylase-like uncharacterized protein
VPAELDGVEVEHGKPHTAAAGTTLRIGSATTGVRTYLALEGGIAVDPVLGSMSADTLSGIGPAPLSVGDVLPLGNSRGEECRTVAGIAPGPLRLGLGPRHDRFEPAALDAILNEPFTVSPTSNRIGLRLTGPLLGWATHTELRSEGIATGSVQVPPNGQPIVMLADHPTTGGYPVIGVIDSGSLALAAQLRPGTEISFVLTA